MKNTKNFILVGATLLFSALSTCAFAQTIQGHRHRSTAAGKSYPKMGYATFFASNGIAFT